MTEYLNDRGFFKKSEILSVAIVDQNNLYLFMDLKEFPEGTKPPEPFILKAPDIEAGEKESIQWQGSNWVLVENHLGEVWYSTVNGVPYTINSIGKVPDNLTDKPRPNQFSVFVNGEWTEDEELKTQHNIEVNTYRKNELLAEVEKMKIDLRDRILVGDATTDNQKKLKKLIDYSDALDLVDLGVDNPDFPDVPQF